jgi:hypothetical protein
MRLILFKPDTYVDPDSVESLLPAAAPGWTRVLLRCGKEVRVEAAPMDVSREINRARERES